MANPYTKTSTFSPEIANALLDMQRGLSASIDSRMRSLAKPQGSREKQVRIGRTVSVEFSYPSGVANKYEVELGEPTFDLTSVGVETPTFTPYTPQKVKIAAQFDAVQIPEGTLIHLELIHGKYWIINPEGGGSGSTIIFQIVTESGVAEAASNDCDDQLKDGGTSYMANVLWRPCGVSKVPEETDDGLVEVLDPLEAFFKDRENSEIQGRMGIATYMVEDGGYDCQWVITFIDWFREIQIVHDVIHTEEEIRFKIKKIKTWDDCDLPDVVIPLIDCRDES